MLCPSLWQYGALPAGSSWQLQERSLPGGNSEVLRQVWSSYYLDYVCLICCFQLHVLNGWIKSGLWNWSLLGISVGWRTGTCHFQCRYLKLENGRGADFCTSYHLGLLQLNTRSVTVSISQYQSVPVSISQSRSVPVSISQYQSVSVSISQYQSVSVIIS